MVFMGPDPPSVDDLSTPNCTMPADLIEEESDDDHDPYSGYQPLPQAPESADAMLNDDDSDEDTPSNDGDNTNVNYLPPIETVEQEVIRHVWTAPRTVENIEMNLDKAQLVMSAMANFSLPASSIPDWANTLTEDHWKQQLSEKINHLNGKR